MAYKTLVTMNIAIIGTGNSGVPIATCFARGGHNIYMAWKDSEQPIKNCPLMALDNVHCCRIENAAAIADLIIIACAPKDVREVAYWLGDVRKKVIIDASANVFVPCNETMTTTFAIESITGASNIVKVFNAKGYEKILKPLFKGEHIELLLVGDSRKAKEVVKILAIELDIKKHFDMGESDAIPLFDELTKCWRSLAVAQNLIPGVPAE